MSSQNSRSRPVACLVGAACLLLGRLALAAPPDGTFTRFNFGAGLSADYIAPGEKGGYLITSKYQNTYTWIDAEFGVHNYTVPIANSYPGPVISYCGGALFDLANVDRFAQYSYLPKGSAPYITYTSAYDIPGILGPLVSGWQNQVYAGVNNPSLLRGYILSTNLKSSPPPVTYDFGAKSITDLNWDFKNKFLWASDIFGQAIYRSDFSKGTTPVVTKYTFQPGFFGTASGGFARGCNGETYFTASQSVYRAITTNGTTTFDGVKFTELDPAGIMVRREDCNLYLTLNGAHFYIGQLQFNQTPGGQPTFNIVGQSDVYLGYIGGAMHARMPYIPLRGASNFPTNPASVCPALDFAVQGNNPTTHGDDLYWFTLPQQTCPPRQDQDIGGRERLVEIPLRYTF